MLRTNKKKKKKHFLPEFKKKERNENDNALCLMFIVFLPNTKRTSQGNQLTKENTEGVY